MSTTFRFSSPVKKTSSCVRPGVRDMRARFLRPVSALIRLDLPTLERPAKAISTPRIDGSDAGVPAAPTKRHSRAKRRRPASISARVKRSAVIGASISSASCPCIAVQTNGVLAHAYSRPNGRRAFARLCRRHLRLSDTKDVDGRDKPGHDVDRMSAALLRRLFLYE